ncbi:MULTISPECIES: hypothetical protein [Mammaliicoccus]|uniref:hypothetical protein n=1 Tax=Mammaliicoccus TaxID=2803850 RepID=UPI001EFC01E3|nr:MULTISPECIES: hypothetical protein [Mammaliicoccus]
MFKQLKENELQELHVIHQVMHQLSLAHRPLVWRRKGLPKNNEERKLVINTLAYLSLIHSEIENINDVLLNNTMYDVYSYKKQVKEAISRADNHYKTSDLYPDSVRNFENIRNLLEI